MTRIRLRAVGLAIHSARVQIFYGSALACAVLLMGFFTRTLQLSIERGQSLREVQRQYNVGEAHVNPPLRSKPSKAAGISASR
jgi:hypothetical protein